MTKTFAPESEKALSFPVGAVSPLWFVFAGAAAAGAAVFWARQWLKPVNIEAMAALAPLPPVTAEAAEPVVEAVETMVELAVEAVDTMVEVAAETLETAADLSAESVETMAAIAEPLAEAVVEPVIEAAPETAETAVDTAATRADDLTRLTGIGPKLAASLAERGVTRFADIAAWTADDVEKFDKDMKLMGRIEREAWIAQARRYADGVLVDQA